MKGPLNVVATPNEDTDRAAALETIVDALRGLQFGTVTAVVQDGVVVQVERIEKRRIPRKQSSN